jgi:tetratricopeptide (TPR) repeat protein
LMLKGEIDRAIVDLDRALKLKSDYGDALTVRGAAFLRKKEYARALEDLDRAVALDQSGLESYLVRAQVHEAQGKTDLAIADLRKASQFPPRTAFELLAQAEAKRRIERLTKATPCPSTGDAGTCL